MLATKDKVLPTSREGRIQLVLDTISEEINQPLEPAEYCDRWVNHPLHLRDYKKHCDRAIAEACGFFLTGEVSGWGRNWSKRPAYIPQLLRLADIVKRAQALGVCPNKTQSWAVNRSHEITITLPFGIPKPQFYFWQRVKVVDEQSVCGVVVGMEYVPAGGDCSSGWWYAIDPKEGLPSEQKEPIRQVHEQSLRSLNS